MSASAAIGYKPTAGSANRGKRKRPKYPTAIPIAAPPIISAITRIGINQAAVSPHDPLATILTITTTGASLNPASASRSVRTFSFTRMRRSSEKTAAASVAAKTVPKRIASCGSKSKKKISGSATTPMLTATPTDARASEGASTGRS